MQTQNSTERTVLAETWPQFGLRIDTPRLTLQLPTSTDLPALANAARTIQQTPPNQQFQLPWIYGESPAMERTLYQRYWRALAHWRPESWHLHLAIYIDGQPVGLQEMWANQFDVLRCVGTGSWIASHLQGSGYGTEARAAILELAFGHLGATAATSECLEGNAASAAVSRKLGYLHNGHQITIRHGTPIREYRLLLEADAWKQYRRADCYVSGVEQCLRIFGVDES